MNETQHGHLLLADITGYTSYVATTELTHSQEILTELLETIIAQFKPLLTISKIEATRSLHIPLKLRFRAARPSSI